MFFNDEIPALKVRIRELENEVQDLHNMVADLRTDTQASLDLFEKMILETMPKHLKGEN